MIDPVLMGAVEQKLVEALLRLQEAFKIMNHLKRLNGYEVKELEDIVTQQTNITTPKHVIISDKPNYDGPCQIPDPDTCLIHTDCTT